MFDVHKSHCFPYLWDEPGGSKDGLQSVKVVEDWNYIYYNLSHVLMFISWKFTLYLNVWLEFSITSIQQIDDSYVNALS